ncbi:hypothetical protein AGABI1DRAFT_92652 [Agaricus bisporus var. burnettii JB137-S8]|uniref:Uncharacterized protein n=1 Tax=Agaricus bisporus var. burnettii (strain JB137-S8 / ATCC MYA-4627 / FGSC 10392) TaxID=597362 RepID=K5X5U6_AGABU|nr:uncharacterized protein AGABI1DRAFT_92652 [Agaricus bisporus var. burnettii JB137-S8]EKM78322.1 hypothetical protein AGABI1DRAFT_92652 [Agaricus bisporus var. burnettii JB137-S8]
MGDSTRDLGQQLKIRPTIRPAILTFKSQTEMVVDFFLHVDTRSRDAKLTWNMHTISIINMKSLMFASLFIEHIGFKQRRNKPATLRRFHFTPLQLLKLFKHVGETMHGSTCKPEPYTVGKEGGQAVPQYSGKEGYDGDESSEAKGDESAEAEGDSMHNVTM